MKLVHKHPNVPPLDVVPALENNEAWLRSMKLVGWEPEVEVPLEPEPEPEDEGDIDTQDEDEDEDGE